ncbi:Uma2 family endonuclease [Spiribacter halobius]|uniref:Uma2 family endonuclease n=1 Tax=Sediminicurvatus halobius TaxID=2182432 RepID=UPI001E5AB721
MKMPVYARYGVRYAWIVNSRERTLEAYERRDDAWDVMAAYQEGDEVCAALFEAAVFRVGDLWE